MTALEQPMQSAQEVLCVCGLAMVATKDAIGRVRHRCPACDGVAAPRRGSPDDIALMPQGLVALQNMLPAITPGQLRCQGCAKGVEGQARFCARCGKARTVRPPARGTNQQRRYNPKPCAKIGCETLFLPSGPRALFCEEHR